MGLPRFFSSPREHLRQDVEAVNEPLQDRSQRQTHRHQHSQSFPRGSTARLWLHRRQRLWLLFHFSWRWLITAALVASAAGVLVAYERRQILSNSDKHIFNFLITGLVVAVSVNFTGALSHIAGSSRWLFLSCTSLPPRMFELVMGLDSQTNVMKLMWAAKGRWIIRSVCLAWLLLNLSVQVLAALLGLTYSVENPLDAGDNSIQGARGEAAVVDLSYIGDYTTVLTERPGVGSPLYLDAQRASANNYGLQSGNWGEAKAKASNFIENPSLFENYFQELTKTEWRWVMRFFDYPASQVDSVGSDPNGNVVSQRAVGSTAVCHSDTKVRSVRYGTPSTIEITNDDGDFSIEVPTNLWNSTTYMSDTRADYGPRTTRVLVFWSGESTATHEPLEMLYDCNNTVTTVRHLTGKTPVRDDLQLQDTQARIIAGGIGWFGASSNATFQTHSYDSDSRWNFVEPLKNWVVADDFVSRFAIGSLVAMNFNAPRVKAKGLLLPNGGVIIYVKWVYAGTVLALIAVLHLLLLVIADMMLSKVLIRDDGYFATAVFLKPLLSNMPARGGGMMDSGEIADTVGQDIMYTWDEHGEDLESDDTEYKKGMEDVKYLRAKTVQGGVGRTRFHDAVYD